MRRTIILLILLVSLGFAFIPLNFQSKWYALHHLEFCPTCAQLADAPQARMFTLIDENQKNLEIRLFYENASDSPPRQGISDSVVIVELSNTTGLYQIYKTYTNSEGVANFDFTPYSDACVNFKVLYCPYCTPLNSSCPGFRDCIELSGFESTAQNADQIPDAPDAAIPGSLNSKRFLPELAQASYCAPPPPLATTPPICLPLLIIFSLLGGALYLTGRNPFAGFQLGRERLGRHIRYQARSRGMYMSGTSALYAAQSIAQTAQQGVEAAFKSGVMGMDSETGKVNVLHFVPMGFMVMRGKGAVGSAKRISRSKGGEKGGSGQGQGGVAMVGGQAIMTGGGSTSGVRGVSEVFKGGFLGTLGRMSLFFFSESIVGRTIDAIYSASTGQSMFEAAFINHISRAYEGLQSAKKYTDKEGKVTVTLEDGTEVAAEGPPKIGKDGKERVTVVLKSGVLAGQKVTLTFGKDGSIESLAFTLAGAVPHTAENPKGEVQAQVSFNQKDGTTVIRYQAKGTANIPGIAEVTVKADGSFSSRMIYNAGTQYEKVENLGANVLPDMGVYDKVSFAFSQISPTLRPGSGDFLHDHLTWNINEYAGILQQSRKDISRQMAQTGERINSVLEKLVEKDRKSPSPVLSVALNDVREQRKEEAGKVAGDALAGIGADGLPLPKGKTAQDAVKDGTKALEKVSGAEFQGDVFSAIGGERMRKGPKAEEAKKNLGEALVAVFGDKTFADLSGMSGTQLRTEIDAKLKANGTSLDEVQASLGTLNVDKASKVVREGATGAKEYLTDKGYSPQFLDSMSSVTMAQCTSTFGNTNSRLETLGRTDATAIIHENPEILMRPEVRSVIGDTAAADLSASFASYKRMNSLLGAIGSVEQYWQPGQKEFPPPEGMKPREMIHTEVAYAPPQKGISLDYHSSVTTTIMGGLGMGELVGSGKMKAADAFTFANGMNMMDNAERLGYYPPPITDKTVDEVIKQRQEFNFKVSSLVREGKYNEAAVLIARDPLGIAGPEPEKRIEANQALAVLSESKGPLTGQFPPQVSAALTSPSRDQVRSDLEAHHEDSYVARQANTGVGYDQAIGGAVARRDWNSFNASVGNAIKHYDSLAATGVVGAEEAAQHYRELRTRFTQPETRPKITELADWGRRISEGLLPRTPDHVEIARSTYNQGFVNYHEGEGMAMGAMGKYVLPSPLGAPSGTPTAAEPKPSPKPKPAKSAEQPPPAPETPPPSGGSPQWLDEYIRGQKKTEHDIERKREEESSKKAAVPRTASAAGGIPLKREEDLHPPPPPGSYMPDYRYKPKEPVIGAPSYSMEPPGKRKRKKEPGDTG